MFFDWLRKAIFGHLNKGIEEGKRLQREREEAKRRAREEYEQARRQREQEDQQPVGASLLTGVTLMGTNFNPYGATTMEGAYNNLFDATQGMGGMTMTSGATLYANQ